MRKSSNWVLLILILVYFAKSLQFLPHMSLFRMSISPSAVAKWSDLEIVSLATDAGNEQRNQRELRQLGEGNPHTDSLLRTFGSSKNPDVTFFRDNAGWCPYCQKVVLPLSVRKCVTNPSNLTYSQVWILLEEKNIPYKVEKINMRSYGDKPAEFLRKVPNGLLPAIEINGQVQTESFQIMMYLDQRYHGENYKAMWPKYSNTAEQTRAKYLMNLERKLFSAWCGLVFRPFTGLQSRHLFEKFMDDVNNELEVESGPWFLSHLSIVDLTYISHIERMCASVPYWCGFKVRGDSRWPAIERWIGAFEERPSYMATKSDYYTHVKDIPPQYGQAYAAPGSQAMAATIDGLDGSWNLPLPPFAASDLEPVSAAIDPGSQAACHEAAFALIRNHKAVVKFACRGSGTPGWKQFQVTVFANDILLFTF